MARYAVIFNGNPHGRGEYEIVADNLPTLAAADAAWAALGLNNRNPACLDHAIVEFRDGRMLNLTGLDW